MPRAKKQDINSLGMFNSYADWSTKRLIDEAANMARWNPALAYSWFDQAATQLSIDDYPTMEYFDKWLNKPIVCGQKTKPMIGLIKEIWGTHPISRIKLMLEN